MDKETDLFLSELEQAHLRDIDNNTIVPPGERECPICKQTMVEETEYGVSLDVCKDHGVWLDQGELPRIVSFIRSGNRSLSRRAIKKAKHQGKISALLWGVFSLLSDD